MTVGWVRDHTLLPLVVSVGVALLVAATGDRTVPNPLGDTFTGLSLSLAVALTTAAGCVLALRSRVATELGVPTPTPWRAAWCLTLLLAFVAATAALWGPGADPVQLARVTALVPGAAMVLGLLAGEGAGLVYLFACFAACLLTPRDLPAPWWNPVLHHGGVPSTVVAAAAVLAVLGWLSVAGGAGRSRS